jgi:hypothetical protein
MILKDEQNIPQTEIKLFMLYTLLTTRNLDVQSFCRENTTSFTRKYGSPCNATVEK